jgi:cytochrome c6
LIEVSHVKERSSRTIVYLAVPAVSLSVLALTLGMSGNVNATSLPGGDAAPVYNGKCANCHGRDGRGKTARGKREHARDLSTAEWQDGVSDERIYNSISNGKGKMPGFKKKLSDAQIDELVSYVRRLRR